MSLKVAGEEGFGPPRTVLETVRLPLSYSPMVTGCLRDFALAFTRMAVLATYAPLSFPPVWSCILDLNQGSSRYQHAALPTAPMHVFSFHKYYIIIFNKSQICAQGWNRTSVWQIFSLQPNHLATWAWMVRQDLNLQGLEPQSSVYTFPPRTTCTGIGN